MKNQIPRKKRCYNSGKIGGLNYISVINKFKSANLEIERRGMHPVSPLDNGLKPSHPYWLHMAVDILMLARCGNVYLQADWQTSRGARIEYRVAKFLGLNIWEETNVGLEE